MKKGTSPRAAKAASRVLDNPSSGKAAKTAAGSALTQSKAPPETTSPTALRRLPAFCVTDEVGRLQKLRRLVLRHKPSGSLRSVCDRNFCVAIFLDGIVCLC